MTRVPYFILALLVIGADRYLKWWIQGHVFLPQPLIDGLVRLNLVHNPGGAFGIFPGNGYVFLIVSSGVSVAVAVLLLFPGSRLYKMGLGLVLGGAVGNLIDRVSMGYVVDFFEVRGFSVFNLADACITVGVVLIIIYALFGGGRNRASR